MVEDVNSYRFLNLKEFEKTLPKNGDVFTCRIQDGNRRIFHRDIIYLSGRFQELKKNETVISVLTKDNRKITETFVVDKQPEFFGFRNFINKFILQNHQCYCGSFITRDISWCTRGFDKTWYWKHCKCLTCGETFILEKKKDL